MRRREFIDMILNSISDTFDIYHNYWFEGRKFVIYAYSYNKKDRFSTTDDAKLWDSKCYEHLFFINCDTLGMKELDDLYDFAVNKIEPHFVRGDGKLPAKNHMYTHISFIFRSVMVDRIIYALVGLSGLYLLSTYGRIKALGEDM